MPARTLKKAELIEAEAERLTRLYGPYLTSEQFAEVVAIGKTTVQTWRRDGRGPQPVQVGRRWLYSARRVAEFLEGR